MLVSRGHGVVSGAGSGRPRRALASSASRTARCGRRLPLAAATAASDGASWPWQAWVDKLGGMLQLDAHRTSSSESKQAGAPPSAGGAAEGAAYVGTFQRQGASGRVAFHQASPPGAGPAAPAAPAPALPPGLESWGEDGDGGGAAGGSTGGAAGAVGGPEREWAGRAGKISWLGECCCPARLPARLLPRCCPAAAAVLH